MKKLLAGLLFMLACAYAQTIPTFVVPPQGTDTQMAPQAVPTSTTPIVTTDVYLKGITISNPTSGALAFSLCDRQSTPVCVVGAVSIAANTTYILNWSDGRLYWCPGGFTILGGGGGLTMHGIWKQ